LGEDLSAAPTYKNLSVFKSISVEFIQRAAVVRFTRPEIRNPLSIETQMEIIEAMDSIESKSEIRTLVFTGSGDVFASGANLREIALVTGDTAREFARRGQRLMKKITDAPQRTVAAVNGYCFGGALDLALSCDRRIASENAVFCHPGVNLGIITGWGGTQRLPRLVGEAMALEMFLTAKQVSAAEALQIGLIDRVAENPLEEALRET
jgi:enoyl-CoA hydratase